MSEGKPAKKRKFLVSAKVGDVMAAQTSTSGKSSGNKDSPAVSKASVTSSGAAFQTVPSFPNPVSNPPFLGHRHIFHPAQIHGRVTMRTSSILFWPNYPKLK